MNTYVFGAGASHHAGYPLAGELWNQFHDWACGDKPKDDWCRSCVEEVVQVYGGRTNFEEILTELDIAPPGSPAASIDQAHLGNVRSYLRYCFVRYFDYIRRTPALLYDQFARERIQAGDVIITFNYDLACERALKSAGRWEISDGYGFPLGINGLPSSEVKVLKLHGSTDWLWPIFEGREPGKLFQISGAALPETPIVRGWKDLEYLGYPEELFDRLRPSVSGGALPAVIMGHKRFYVQTSSGGRECEDFWADIWEQAAHAIQSGDNIVIVGYSMPAADTAARELLLNMSRKDASIALWCGEKTSANLYKEFKAHGFTEVVTGPGGCFEHFLAG